MRAWKSFALAPLFLYISTEGRAEESCGTCHPNVRIEYAEGVHVEELGCTSCHGGDPTALDLESHSVAMGYVGRPDRRNVPSLCASCHSDPTRMRSFGLATDQYAQYQTSEHGLRLAQGDTRVAVCTDCHGTHRILRPRQPASPIARLNISATCGRCHSDRALMAEYHLPADQVEKFRSSVHGIALFIEEHPSAPTCATCHGAHGAAAPQVGSIRAVCGHCHARTREYFNEGPHRKATDAGKMSECVSCHGSHDTGTPDRTLFDATCQTCHPPDSTASSAGQKLKTLLSRADESLEACATVMTDVHRVFPTVDRYRPRLQQAKAYFLEALPVQHSLALDRVDDLTRNARSIAEEVQASVHGVAQRSRLRRIGLALAWIFILFAVGVAYLYKKDRQRQRDPDATAHE